YQGAAAYPPVRTDIVLDAIEARNQLFALFTFNRSSRDFFHNVLIGVSGLEKKAANAGERAALERALAALDAAREVLSRSHNPFLLRQVAKERNLTDARFYFTITSARCPRCWEGEAPQLFRRSSLAMENPHDRPRSCWSVADRCSDYANV